MKNNEIPLLFGKVTDKALFNAHDFLNSLKQKYRRIDIAVLCFSEAIADEIHKHYKITVGKVTFKDPKLNSVKIGKKSIFFAKSNIGAPAATTVLEEIIALGAKKIIFIGSTGSLCKSK
ncbi:MAG: hypothetical protein NTY48_07440 [Candidatus Diapherotrites archaeon]|nr:hypothetical protein [Candidatus Diapherotrites archaeon]